MFAELHYFIIIVTGFEYRTFPGFTRQDNSSAISRTEPQFYILL